MSFLQIGSWNIEHLSGQRRADRPQSAFALCDHIEMAGVNLLALQEVYTTPDDEEVTLGDSELPVPIATQSLGDVRRRNATLDTVCYLLNEHLGVPWRYVILPNRNAGDPSQLCAVMWQTDRVELHEVTKLEVDHVLGGDHLWDRTPHVLQFRSQIDVWQRKPNGEWVRTPEKRRLSLVPLHMKSNYGGVTVNRRKRGKEAATLCEALAAVRDSIDPSIVLIGDTNILNNAEPAVETFLEHGFVDLNNNDAATYWSKEYGESPFDRIFVAEGRPEFRYARQYVLKSSDLEGHDRLLSDHFMIKASVKDYVDDRDPR